MGLINTPFALIISYILFTLPLSIWLLKSYFDALSPEIEEAALVDGASRLRTLWIIVAPLARRASSRRACSSSSSPGASSSTRSCSPTSSRCRRLLASYQSLQTFTWNTLAAADGDLAHPAGRCSRSSSSATS